MNPPTLIAFARVLKPSMLTGLFLGLLLAAQFVLFSNRCTTDFVRDDSPATTVVSFGIGSPVTMTTVNDTTIPAVHGMVLAGNLAVCYALAAILAAAFRKATCLHRPARACGLVVLAMVVVSFGLSICYSKWYWGYWMGRPPILGEIHDVASVTAVLPVRTETSEDGGRRIVPDPGYRMAERLAFARRDPYYLLEERVLQALEEKKLLPAASGTDLRNLPSLFPLIRKSGLMVEPEQGYTRSDLLNGVVVDAVGRAGERLVFVAVTGRELSNDHYPYYEMLFRGRQDSTDLSYVRGQRFLYDVAGQEGVEWYAVWPFLGVACTVLGFVGLAVFFLVRRKPAGPPSDAPSPSQEGVPSEVP